METIRLPVQRLSVEFAASEANRDARTVPMTFYSGATVLRFDWEKGTYNLALSMEPGHSRLGQLNSGRAPFTMGHASPNDPAATIGVIENARIENGKAKANVRFSKRAEVDPIFADVLDGIMPNVSMGVRIHKLKETTAEGDKTRSFLSTDWEPLAVALVGLGADSGAHFAAETDSECELEALASIITRENPDEELRMPEVKKPGEGTPEPKVNEAEVALAAQTAERSRVLEIGKVATKHKMDPTFTALHIEQGTTIEAFRSLVLDELAKRSEAQPSTKSHHAEITRDQRDTVRLCAGEQLDILMGGSGKPSEQNDFAGMGVLRLAEEMQIKLGKRPRSRAEIVELSMHATADFPLILANSARKRMLAGYDYAKPTYRLWSSPSTSPDFKTMDRLRLSETPSFLAVPEGAQIQLGVMSESREQYALATFGRGVSFTRQMLINDDLGAFNSLQFAFGIQAARIENKTVYAILIANANMSDSTALFHANHGNLGTGVIGNTALDAMFTAFAVQKGLDGVSVLNLVPKFLIVPAAKAATAANSLTAVGPSVKASDQNWFTGRLTPVSDAELDASSTVVWYGACDPQVAPGIEYCHLQGAEGPQSVRKENEQAVLGVQIYNYLDFAAKAVDFRTLYKSSGA